MFLQNDNAVGWDELPAAGMASGAALNQRADNPISPEKSLLSRDERTAPPRNPRAPTPIDPKEEEARKAIETIPVKAVAFKDQQPGKDKTPEFRSSPTPVDKVYPSS